MRYPGFVGPSYKSSAYMADSEELINFLIEKNETPNAPSPYCLLPTPGFADEVEADEGPGRGSIQVGSSEFFVQGFAFYEYASGALTLRGTISANANPATLSWNGPAGGQIFITSGDVGYNYDIATTTLTVVIVSGATMGAFLDGYFLCIDAATGTLRISDLLDGLTWDPTQIAQRTGGPDPWVAMTVIHTEIWLGGSRTMEVWRNAGLFPFPFAPIPGAFLEQGIAAPFSAIRDVSPLVWVSANAQGQAMVLMAQGYQGVRISTHAVEKALQSYSTIADAISFSFQMLGHTLVALIFPTADASWLYDVTEGAWCKWSYWNTLTSSWEAVRVRTHVLTADGVHLMQDRASGAIYRMSSDLYTDVDGSLILRERTPPRMSAPGQVRFTVPSIELVMDVGVGQLGASTTDPSVNPAAMLQTSRDGGRTWGPERTASIGRQGEYGTRVTFHQCGQARNRVDRFRFAADCPIRIADAEIEVSVGTS